MQEQNDFKDAKKYYTEALEIRRALAKTNPDAFKIDYTRTLIMGVDLFGEDRGNLQEAKRYS
ncbi:MAG: hypothetical protein IE878_04890 [Epsilonproteobacteria bacterium]|nr:hypothetical protein [Campylobacterota bacterium]MBD3839709.1 hypothetical protein [Campylobacterota bacterium]